MCVYFVYWRTHWLRHKMSSASHLPLRDRHVYFDNSQTRSPSSIKERKTEVAALEGRRGKGPPNFLLICQILVSERQAVCQNRNKICHFSHELMNVQEKCI